MPKRRITEAEMHAARTPNGGWDARQLRSWGVLSPPPRGWRRRLLRDGVPAACPYPDGFEASRASTSDIPTNPLLAFTAAEPGGILPADAVRIFTDGSCRPNPGPGGWGFAAYRDAIELHAERGGAPASTNNRMELQAVIAALTWLDAAQAAIVWTDSQYVARGCIEWQHGWRKANWTRNGKAPPANADLWRTLGVLLDSRTVAVRWTRGHTGTAGNDRADALAGEGRRTVLR